ncbi:MAG TPA: hypothetical protein VGM27_27350, partial [Acidobacteriaceae bacterium]
SLPTIPGRRVIQIAAIPASQGHSYGVIALCEDGTIWDNFFAFEVERPEHPHWTGWEQLPFIPS